MGLGSLYGGKQLHSSCNKYLSHGDDELARPEVGEEKVERAVADVVGVLELFHRDRAPRRLQGCCGYLGASAGYTRSRQDPPSFLVHYLAFPSYYSTLLACAVSLTRWEGKYPTGIGQDAY